MILAIFYPNATKLGHLERKNLFNLFGYFFFMQAWYAVNEEKKEMIGGQDYGDSIASPVIGTAVLLLTTDRKSDGKGVNDMNLESFAWPHKILQKLYFVGRWHGDRITFTGERNITFNKSEFMDITTAILPGVIAMCLSQDTLRNRMSMTEQIKPLVHQTMKELGMSKNEFKRFATKVEEIEMYRQRLKCNKRY